MDTIERDGRTITSGVGPWQVAHRPSDGVITLTVWDEQTETSLTFVPGER